MDYLDTLNPEQRAAVEHFGGPLLILAGAGSGKTRVLTHRIAHLIFKHNVDPRNIFAVTFTNKAAAEMRSRAFGLLGIENNFQSANELWISTFHSACVRILRSDIHHLGYQTTFTIYDDADQRSVIKACMKELNLAESTYAPKAIQARINAVKNEGQDASTYESKFGGPFEDAFIQVFERYTEALKSSSALDFADLILVTIRLFQEHPKVLAAYQERFHHIMVDEYQDTNHCQYLLLKMLAGQRHQICAVGDEDQSIYRWRGADISNILNFEEDFPDAKIFKLEQNYRSTKNIIESASHVIAQNTERRDKKLWTDNETGDKIRLIEAYDEHDEAAKIGSEISKYIDEGISLSEMAIFYRTNAQSRLLEDTLRAKGTNYMIFGGLKFYSRLEVKDAMAFLRLICNPLDDVSFRRIVNVPARGIGKLSVERLSESARMEGLSLYQYLDSIFGPNPTNLVNLGRPHKKLKAFFDMIENLRKHQKDLLPSDLLNLTLDETGYRKSISISQDAEAQSRLENLAELQQSIVEYELRFGAEHPNDPVKLEGFLEQIALVSDIDRFDPDAPAIKLMTVHMAKGLEFENVFIVGVEEELMPSVRPWEGEEVEDVEEERRLFYVAMTRAKQRLHLLYAKNRTIFGTSSYRVMSRFIEEIPEDYYEWQKSDFFERRNRFIDRPGLLPRKKSAIDAAMEEEAEYSQVSDYDDHTEGHESDEPKGMNFDSGSIRQGVKVLHPAFGEGIVHQVIGSDKLIVNFKSGGLKKISLKYGQLERI